MHPTECIIDVGSASIGICMSTDEKGKPAMSKTARTPLSDGGKDTATLPQRALAAVQKALDGMKGVPPPKQVRVVLAAPWYDGKIRTIVTSSEKQVRVNTGTVERSVKEYLTQKNEGVPGAGRRIIESVVSQAYVNGYPTALKKPVIGKSMKINYYQSEADDAFLKDLTDAVKKTYPHADVTFHSFALVACLVLRMTRPEENFIMADIGGEITDIVVAHHDGLRFIGTYPIGTLSIVRAFAGEKGTVADASSRLVLFAKNELSTEESVTAGEAFKNATAAWGKEFQTLLEGAVKEVGIPQTTFLFADREELKWLTRLVSGTFGMFSTRAVSVTPDFFQTAVLLGEGGVYDSFLAVESLYFYSHKEALITV